MRQKIKKKITALLVILCILTLTACSGQEQTSSGEKKTAGMEAIAGVYYIDLTELGMKLTFYLQIEESGAYLFSNTLDFETNKSSGTLQQTEDGYMMVYDSVNGEEKTAADGLTTHFVLLEDGSLDFSGENGCIYYGSARATTSSADDSDAKLIAYPVSEDYAAPESKSEFQTGSYTAETVQDNGTEYTHAVSFFEDNSYLHLMTYEEEGQLCFDSEIGTYSVSTTQLALQPEEGERISCEVEDASHLTLSVLAYAGAEERTQMQFVRTTESQIRAEFTGIGTAKGSEETFETTVILYTDGSYESTADGFTESGILVLDTAEHLVKQYPDHPESGVRGLNQVATVPAGTLTEEDGTLILNGLRIRRSESLNRDLCDAVQIG